jgi:hypothetical protein
MPIYDRAQSQVTGVLSIGVLQGDTLASFLLVIIIDYFMREALSDQT